MVLEAGVCGQLTVLTEFQLQEAPFIQADPSGELVAEEEVYPPAAYPHVVCPAVVDLSCIGIPGKGVHLFLPLDAPGTQGQELLQVPLPLL